MAPVISNKGNSVATTATTIAVSGVNANAGDIVVCVFANIGANGLGVPTAVQSVADTNSLSWNARYGSGVVTIDTGSPATKIDLEIWWALASSSVSGDTVMATYSSLGGIGGTAIYFSVSGANTAAPFDSNGSMPATVIRTTTGHPTVSVNTNNANDLIFGIIFATGLSLVANHPGSGFTALQLDSQGLIDSEYQIVSAIQSGLTVQFAAGDDPSVPRGCLLLSDAIQAVANLDLHTQQLRW
jgi:hypothetical protein